MVSVITNFSRITILSYVIIFTLIDCVLLFEPKLKEGLNSILVTIQAVMIVLLLVNGSIVLYYSTEEPRILLLLVLELLFFSIFALVINKITVPVSKGLINNVLFLISMSLITLERLSLTRAARQFIFCEKYRKLTDLHLYLVELALFCCYL